MSLCHQQYVRMYVRGFLERHFSAGSPQSSKGSLIEDAFTFFAPPVGLGTGRREQPPPSSLSALHNGAKSMIFTRYFLKFHIHRTQQPIPNLCQQNLFKFLILKGQ